MSWRDQLWQYCANPENFPTIVVKYNNDYVAINDQYPKSKKHFLVMPRKRIGLKDLTKQDIPMILEMEKMGSSLIHDNQEFKMGFHAVPSMNQLHLHVVSVDHVSTCLKLKKHYLSFTTDFFVPVDTMIDFPSIDIEKYEALLKGKLVCHHCKQEFKTMPKLKQHLEEIYK
ncbi:hypothetical protein HDV04_003049 [Boothiomyces sp. JEL0838]|nr:hypothetical protein HDV04_003049 [Boothiomyces sp. JEL0838]